MINWEITELYILVWLKYRNRSVYFRACLISYLVQQWFMFMFLYVIVYLIVSLSEPWHVNRRPIIQAGLYPTVKCSSADLISSISSLEPISTYMQEIHLIQYRVKRAFLQTCLRTFESYTISGIDQWTRPRYLSIYTNSSSACDKFNRVHADVWPL